MTDLVVFVEEPSAGIVVRELLARLAPERATIVVEHEGKSDLKASFPRKIKAWVHPAKVPFIVLQDNDGADCRKLKRELVALVPERRLGRTTVRIVMQCLESWYLGDPDAVANAKQEFLRLHKQEGQLLLARTIAPHLSLTENRSESFKIFMRTARATLMG